MFRSPLGSRGTQMTSPLGASGGVSAWWLSGDISPSTVDAVYLPYGAASSANALLNIHNPGTNDAITTVAPLLWDAEQGWYSAGSRYLETSITPDANSSAIIRYSVGSGVYSLFGARNGGSGFFYVSTFGPGSGNLIGWRYGASTPSTSPNNVSGSITMASNKGYVNGTLVIANIGPWSGTSLQMYIGALNNTGSPGNFIVGNIYWMALYKNTPLSAAQIAAVLDAAPI